MKIASVTLLLTTAALVSGNRIRYDGHQVLRFFPETEKQLLAFNAIYRGEAMRLDFWEDPSKLNSNIDVRVSPEQKEKLESLAKTLGMKYTVMIEDVQKLIDNEKVAPIGSKMSWTDYHRFDDIITWVGETVAAYPDIVTSEIIGTSTEGRDMVIMRINKPSGEEKTGIFIESHVHAREWITSATTTWMVQELLSNPAHESILDQFDIHFIPVLNPDGMEYSHTMDRMWRKTRSDHNSIFQCKGVDGNRNWGHGFGGPGTSTDKCSDTYHGPGAFSEPEIKAAADYIDMHKDELDAFFDIHSYSQYVLMPWGHVNAKPDDYQEMLELGLVLEAGLERRYGTRYSTGTVPDLLYLAAGGAFDWVKAEAGVKWAYGMELRDTGWWGFLLPADQIIPSGEETLDGMIDFINGVRDRTRSRKN